MYLYVLPLALVYISIQGIHDMAVTSSHLNSSTPPFFYQIL